MNEPFLIRTLKQQKILIKELTPLENALLKAVIHKKLNAQGLLRF
ncbi:hypothetical protein N204_07890 [Helicobacter pylori UM085]|nr:hypothetical protein N204_07890 [Helicobacter pylori UM085]